MKKFQLEAKFNLRPHARTTAIDASQAELRVSRNLRSQLSNHNSVLLSTGKPVTVSDWLVQVTPYAKYAPCNLDQPVRHRR